VTLTSLWRERPIAGRWTLKDIVQGKPFGHPSHALFVHFPSALLPVAFVLDVASRLHADNALVKAALYDVAIGLLIASGAVVTGLVDYLPMVGGSRKKKLGTYHLLAQLWALAFFCVSFVLRFGDLDLASTAWPALVTAGLGAAGILVGNYFGGELVYRQGMRVSVDDL